MKFGLVIICLIVCSNTTWAQNAVSNQRDVYGNLLRNQGPYAVRGINQGPVNNGPIRSTPAQPITTNPAGPNGASR